ncbi:MAG: hypothetical protein LBD62_05235 [Candidatus Margulisbacteria bacterium]|jgi:hypothetical protein|nr:hypothetical protein [Candidatus Margulisiibacteriota bacterium]
MRVKTSAKINVDWAKISETAAWIFIGVFLVFWFFINYSTICGLDFTTSLMQAKSLAESGRLFQNFRAGINLTNLLIYTPLFKLSGNFALVRAVGRLLTQILLLLSCVFFTKQLGVKKPWRLLTAGILFLLPVGADNYIFLMNNGLTYALILTLFGFFLGLPLAKNRAAQNIFFIALAFLSGVCSFQLYFFCAPQELLPRVSGFLVKFWQFLGFYPGVQVFSLRGIFSLASIIFGLLLFKLWREDKPADERSAVLRDFLAKAFLFTLAVSVLTRLPCGDNQYPYFVLFIFLAPFIALHFNKHGFQKPLGIFLLIYLLAGGLYAFGSYYKFAKENTKIHAPLAAFLSGGEYRFGYYASYCHRGKVLEELTNGKIHLAPLNLSSRSDTNWEPQWGTFVLLCNAGLDRHRTHAYLQNSAQLYSDANYTLFILNKPPEKIRYR